MKEKPIVPNNLKQLRKKRGIQQKFVAKSIGISANYYCQIENGHRVLPTKYLPIIRELFDVTLDEIFFEKEIAKCDSNRIA
ncbi:helix-turn-helix domain-containing protein [Lysinibacillus boronitolerans]|uniref:helix-turn-helix domain-containing protein n=1 Tax=Lysinibacillus boronitolerans TaxID=309788 RepID=UPI0021621FB9|nr:helix-turn-helix transcriptional regulator [Lysinibacillus boronitolerans]MCS1393494.1 helix-turn-helix domain-containing protein [Lysinibacillus boronitolerans]